MILKFWRWLFGGCDHKWELISSAKLASSTHTYGYIHTLQCEKCGDISSRKIKVGDML